MSSLLNVGKFRAVVWSAVGITGLVFASAAPAALQVKEGLVNTSVGVQPTNATNKWKLTVDPVILGDPYYAAFIPIAGELDNTYDPTKFRLDLSPTTNNYALGWSVQGLGAYGVTSFDVYFKNGGYDSVVQDPTNTAVDDVTPHGDVGGGEAGIVTDIQFSLIPSLRNLALPANEDQDFYQLNLVPLDPELVDPGVVTTYADDQSFLELGAIDPGNPVQTVITYNNPGQGGVIAPSTNAPEPASVGLIAVGVMGLLARRRR